MKGNFPNLVKEIDMQVQEAKRVPNKLDQKMTTPRHIIMEMLKVKVKERILKAAKENKLVIYRECQLISQKKLCRLEGIDKKYSKS